MKIKVIFDDELEKSIFEKFLTRGFHVKLLDSTRSRITKTITHEYELEIKDKGGRKKKLSEEEIIEVQRLHQEGMSYQQLADQYGVTRLTIINYCKK